MDQRPSNTNSSPGENESFFRRSFRALRSQVARPRRSTPPFAPLSLESLEVRQVLSAAPVDSFPGFDPSLTESDDVIGSTVEAYSVELSAEEQSFLESAVELIERNVTQVLVLNRVPHVPQTVVANLPQVVFGSTDVLTAKPPELPPLTPAFDAEPPHQDLIPPDLDEPLPGDDSPDALPPFDLAAPDFADAWPEFDKNAWSESFGNESIVAPPIPPDELPIDPSSNAPMPPFRGMHGAPDDLQVHFRFEWDDRPNSVEVQRPDDTTLVIIVRGPAPHGFSPRRRQFLEDKISEATVSIVQFVAPGTSVRVSLFSTNGVLKNHGRGEQLSSVESSEGDLEPTVTPDAPASATDSLDTEIPSLDLADLNGLEPAILSESVQDLDVVFAGIDDVLFSILTEDPGSSPQARSTTSPADASGDDSTLALSLPSVDDAIDVVSVNLNLDLMSVQLLTSSAFVGDISAATTPTDERSSDRASRQPKATSSSVLRLLFDEDDANDTLSAPDGRITIDQGSVAVSTQSDQTALRRQRVSQRDASNASLLAFWQDEENTLPPIPSSDGAPREIQLAERSRGPPLLHSARDDLLTDYEAPASLLERLRYSISPRGPSLVTVDVQLPEAVLFGAES